MTPNDDPEIDRDLVERVTRKLGFERAPSVTLSGLNAMYSAVSGSLPNDNVQRRIWYANGGSGPVVGSDPTEFFENWIAHGTGGSCFAINGAICTLFNTLGFSAHRLAGSIEFGGGDSDANHGSCIVTLNGVDYLVDGQLAAFRALPLVQGQPAATGHGMHDIWARPSGETFEICFFPGPGRRRPLIFRLQPEYIRVDHAFFVERHFMAASRSLNRSPFNDCLFVARRTRDSMVLVSRSMRVNVEADGTVHVVDISEAELLRVLVEELGYSEEIVASIPPDEEGGLSPLASMRLRHGSLRGYGG